MLPDDVVGELLHLMIHPQQSRVRRAGYGAHNMVDETWVLLQQGFERIPLERIDNGVPNSVQADRTGYAIDEPHGARQFSRFHDMQLDRVAARHCLANHKLTAGEKMQSVILCSFLDEKFAIFEPMNVHYLQQRSGFILAELMTQGRVV